MTKILVLSILKAIEDDNFIVSQMVQFFFDTSAKLCEKRRKYWLPSITLFPTLLLKGLIQRVSLL